MAEEGKHVITCNAAEDGVCGLHNVEVERRSIDRTRLADLKREFEDFQGRTFKDFKSNVMGHIGNLCSFKNRMLGVGVLGTVVVLGSYGYGRMVQSEMHVVVSELENQIKFLREQQDMKMQTMLAQVNSNRTDMAVLASQLGTTNDRLKEAITLFESIRRENNK